MLYLHKEDISELPVFSFDLEPWLHAICAEESKELTEVNVIFCSDEHLLELNREHLNHDYYTDIITFDYCVDNQIIGDLFISVDRVADNASSMGLKGQDELERVIAHGVLHLCGYGDATEGEKSTMRAREDFSLSLRPSVSRGT